MRDDFPEATKKALALRAGYHCSFTGCGRLTAGPSDEGPMAVASIGVAAHISAASPGGRRFLSEMSTAERQSIENGIWLCSDHATLIDRDEKLYPIDVLKEMKRRHEERCGVEVRGTREVLPRSGLLAVGPDIVFVAELIGLSEDRWTFRIAHAVVGDIHILDLFVDGFRRRPEYDRYVVASAIGDGRILAAAPILSDDGHGYVIACPVQSRAPRRRADQLPMDLDVAGGDLSLDPRGDIATVSGLDALPQNIQLGLGISKGEMFFARDFGARLSEYYKLFVGTVWLEEIFKLEVTRLAAIPYHDEISRSSVTPLVCVDRVYSVTAHGERAGGVEVTVELEVHGVGRWVGTVTIRIA